MRTLRLDTEEREQVIDITDRVEALVATGGVEEGLCLIHSPHTTCAVTVNEGFDPDVAADAVAHLRTLVPARAGFRHAEGNSDAHPKAMLVGPAVSLPVSGGRLRLGRWQRVLLCEFDGPRRDREIWVVLR